MFQEYIVYGLEGLAGFVLINTLLLGFFTALQLPWINDFKIITAEWMNFIRRGVPVPADSPKFEKRLPGEEMIAPLKFLPEASTFETETYVGSSLVRS